MINQSAAIYDHLRTHAGFEVTVHDLVEMFTEKGVAVKPASISAILSNMPNITSRPGVVKVEPGVYSYRPGEVSAPAGNNGHNKPGKVSGELIRWFERGGGPIAATGEIAEATGLTTKQVSQSLSYLTQSDPRFRRVKPGVWEYDGSTVRPSDNGTFAPVLEAIPDYAFDEVGMKVVGRTKDGDRLAIDEKGTAWAVNITVTAKLV